MKRIDVLITERGLCESRTRSAELVRGGFVRVNGNAVTKPSFLADENSDILLIQDGICPYVSRGGLKLEEALKSFSLSPSGLVCLDIGASTGGFTDCLLKNGALKVFAVDSGSAQLHTSLRNDSRVISIENCNARYLTVEQIPDPIGFSVMDVSFISQTKLYSALKSLLCDDAVFISLIKPQFEVGRSGIGKGGIVKDQKSRKEAIDTVIASAELFGFHLNGLIESPIKGGDGNTEYLAYFIYSK